MTIHVTPVPSTLELAAPAFTLGVANAAGAALTAVSSNSTLLTFDTTAVDAITFGQSGNVGTATTASRRDHAHAMESETPTTAATQAEMEAASSTTLMVTPGRNRYHPGVGKGWLKMDGTGTISILASYNVASITDNSAGNYTVTWDVDFTSTSYNTLGSSNEMHAVTEPMAAGSALLTIFNASHAAVDSGSCMLAAFGELVDE